MQIDPENERMSRIMSEEEMEEMEAMAVQAFSDDIKQMEKLQADLEKAGYEVKK